MWEMNQSLVGLGGGGSSDLCTLNLLNTNKDSQLSGKEIVKLATMSWPHHMIM